MAILNFPSSPSDGDQYTINDVIYTWDNTQEKWTANDAQDLDARFVNVSGDTMTGNLNVPSLNGGPLGLRNQLINGDLSVNERGMTQSDVTSTDNQWIIDRWSTRSNETYKLQNTPVGAPTARQIEWTGGCTIRQGVELIQNVGGNCQNNQFQPGTTWTFSFYSDTSGITDFNVAAGFYNATRTGGDATDLQNVTATEVETETNFSRYQATVTVGDQCNGNNRVYRWSLSKASGDFSTFGFQLEPGTVCTPLEIRPTPLELQLAQRYFVRMNLGTNGTATGQVYKTAGGTGAFPLLLQYPVLMRAKPTVDLTDVTVRTASGAGATPSSGKTPGTSRVENTGVYMGVGSGLTQNNTSIMDFGGVFRADAEI